MKPAFFSRYEWWCLLALMPVVWAIQGVYFWGTAYFLYFTLFITATALATAAYWLTAFALTFVVRKVIARFPRVDQTATRLGVMFLLSGLLTTVVSIVFIFIYSVFPKLNISFDSATIWPLAVAGLVLDVFICAGTALFHSLDQWRKNEAENEKLERLALESQFDALKGQVNPHFLFNSLNTLSSLISAAPEEAEDFVEDLARIYRYMLQAAKTELIPLQTELDFLKVYIRLLKVRYQEGLSVIQPEHVPAELMLPPLALQILVDNAIQYNVLSAARPLVIRIELTEPRSLRVKNDIQTRHRTLSATNVGLRGLTAKYETLTSRKLIVDPSTEEFSVTVPLLPEM